MHLNFNFNIQSVFINGYMFIVYGSCFRILISWLIKMKIVLSCIDWQQENNCEKVIAFWYIIFTPDKIIELCTRHSDLKFEKDNVTARLYH